MPYTDPVKRREYHKLYQQKYRENPEVKQKEKEWYRQYRQENSEICKASTAKWKKENPERWKEIKRRSECRRVIWTNISVAYETEIRKFYRERPEGYHVDHIIPLKGNSVCGLHVPWNLQYLTEEENLRKGNKI